jgi:hypothetical protein
MWLDFFLDGLCMWGGGKILRLEEESYNMAV